MDGLQTPSGVETPSGLTSVVSTVAGGLETPDFIELRKNTSGVRELGESGGQRQLYQVVPERQTNIRGLMGSERGYDISAVAGAANVEVLGQEGRGKVRPFYLFTISISTDEVSVCLFCILAQDRRAGIDRREGMSEDQLRKRYGEGSCGSGGVHVPGSKEDFSDMVAESAAQASKKRQKEGGKRREKEKEFKF
jgi:splicing factor 3B subunit 2